MSDASEEINRKFDIVADHRATLAVSQQKTDERIARLERVLMLAIRAGQRDRKDTREKINELTESQKRTDVALAQLAEAQAHTEQKLNALIDVVSEGRNGK